MRHYDVDFGKFYKVYDKTFYSADNHKLYSNNLCNYYFEHTDMRYEILIFLF